MLAASMTLVSPGAAPLGVAPLAAQEAAPGVGAKAPVVTVNDLEGEPVDLGAFIGRKPVLIEFWASWCGSCHQLLPAIRAAHGRYGDRVEFLGINITVNDPPERVRRYLAEHAPPFRVLYDDQGASVRAFDVPATSYVVIIDRTGTIVYTGSGGSQRLEPALRRVVEH